MTTLVHVGSASVKIINVGLPYQKPLHGDVSIVTRHVGNRLRDNGNVSRKLVNALDCVTVTFPFGPKFTKNGE